jgi:hypothetical protein
MIKHKVFTLYSKVYNSLTDMSFGVFTLTYFIVDMKIVLTEGYTIQL